MTAIPGPPPVLEPTQDERTMATLAQALSFLGFVPPLIIFFVKRDSRFVSFHALQAVLWHIAYFVTIMLAFMTFAVVMVFTLASHAQNNNAGVGGPPIEIFLAVPLIWLVVGVGSISNLILAVVYAIKAGQGEWADYPLFGRWARRILKIGQR